MALDRFSRTNFINNNLVNGVSENDLPYNTFRNENFKRPRTYYLVDESDIGRPDLISYKNYNKVQYWWIIMKINKIEDVWNDLVVGDEIQIPHINDVEEFIKTAARVN